MTQLIKSITFESTKDHNFRVSTGVDTLELNDTSKTLIPDGTATTSEMCSEAYESLVRPGGGAAQPANDNAESLARNEAVPQELRTALRQMLIATKDVPFTDGSKRALRHEGHALNVTYGSLEVFAT